MFFGRFKVNLSYTVSYSVYSSSWFLSVGLGSPTFLSLGNGVSFESACYFYISHRINLHDESLSVWPFSQFLHTKSLSVCLRLITLLMATRFSGRNMSSQLSDDVGCASLWRSWVSHATPCSFWSYSLSFTAPVLPLWSMYVRLSGYVFFYVCVHSCNLGILAFCFISTLFSVAFS